MRSVPFFILNVFGTDVLFDKKRINVKLIVLVCYGTPFGHTIALKFIKLYNCIVSKILSVLPGGINYTICGIPLKIISL